MDSEFLAISFIFILIGVTGIVLFNGTVPPSGAPCNCIIPTPEPGAAQSTSSIFLVLGIMFFPMGLMKGGLPTFRKTTVGAPAMKQVGGKVVAPVQLMSNNMFGLGIVLLLIAVDALLVPSFLVTKNFWYELSGVMLAAAGALSLAWGLRKPKAQ